MERKRVLLATSDNDLLVALLIFLREEPGIEIVGAVRDIAGIAHLASANPVDVTIVDDGILASSDDVEQLFQHIDPLPYVILLVAGSSIDAGRQFTWADAVVPKHISPELLRRHVQRADLSTAA